ncbi:hypothetical protein [Fodinicurvata sp. EGI_FJ10296]|uniref:hypothetical protein n=1 Tax=Fodinicurvata sp. EGI_FJ10296 TaxID=3231908 RepID=UPI0034518BFA
MIVLNDPDGLLRNVNKLCLQHYPAEVRPVSLISRDIDEIRAFVGERDAPCIIKPLSGSGGRNVFFLEGQADPNIKQMIEAILSEGFVLAQEAVSGNLRLFLMNGEILQVGGTAAVMRRRPKAGEKRGNIRQGAVAELHELTPEIHRLAERIPPESCRTGCSSWQSISRARNCSRSTSSAPAALCPCRGPRVSISFRP